MKHLFYTALLLCVLLPLTGKGQTTLFYENFETGPSTSTFTLNTAENGAVDAATGYNQWAINQSYAGGSGSLVCLSIPLSYSIGATAAQPGAVVNGPNSYYLHILSDEAQADGITCASYLAADGFCFFAQNHFARMTTDISTTGYTGVSMQFYWMCGGASGTNYGELYYSTNAGLSWTLLPTQYVNQTTWAQATVTNAAFDNQSTLRFGWRFVNATTTAASDPGFSLDEVEITGTPLITQTVACNVPNMLTHYCPGTTIDVDYTATGSLNAGNVFSLELSDEWGNFAAPTVIGSVTSTALTGTITGTIPVSAIISNSYRVRVNSSNPAVTGTDNGIAITVWGSDAGYVSCSPDSMCAGDVATLFNSGANESIQWQESADGITWNDIPGAVTSSWSLGVVMQSHYYRCYTTTGCAPADTSYELLHSVFEIPTPVFTWVSNQLTVDFTADSTGVYMYFWDFGDMGYSAAGPQVSHMYTNPGTYTVNLTVSGGLGQCDSTFTQTITVTTVNRPAAELTQVFITPNPVRDVVTLHLDLPAAGEVAVTLYDLTGRHVLLRHTETRGAGNQQIPLHLPGQMASGTYLMQVQYGGRTYPVKLMLAP